MHKPLDELHKQIEKATTQVRINGLYAHYKNLSLHYKVLHIAVEEATDDPCVIYQAQYGDNLIFVRPLKNWLETVEANGKSMLRFTKVNSSHVKD